MEGSAPPVSVLMPVWNGLPFIEEAIDSIVAQTFEDWELIIVDNASDDGTGDYAERRALAEPRIRVLRNQTNIGVTRSLNRGLSACRGEWVARMDSDDRADPTRLERQLAAVRADRDIVVLSCFAHYINARGERISRADHDLTSREAFASYMADGEVIGLLHPGAMIKREAAEAVGGYRPEYELAEDIDLWNRLSERGLVLVLPEYLMEYRLHGGSLVASHMRLSALRRQWVRTGMKARRSGSPEPSWEQFIANWKGATPWTRLNRERYLLSEQLFRAGRQHLAARRSLIAGLEFGVAAALRPVYSLPRFARLLRPMRSNPSRRLAQSGGSSPSL